MEYKQAAIGVWVKIKRHPDDNYWDDAMDEYEGEETMITRQCGNHQHLSIDQGYFSWGIKSLVLTSQDISLINVGSRVILGSHDWIKRDRAWVDIMEKYVGKKTYVINIRSNSRDCIKTAVVEIDGGRFWWRLCNMTLVE